MKYCISTFLLLSSVAMADLSAKDVTCSASIYNFNGGEPFNQEIKMHPGKEDQLLTADFDWNAPSLMGSYTVTLYKGAAWSRPYKYVLKVFQTKDVAADDYNFPKQGISTQLKFDSLPSPLLSEIALGTSGIIGGGNSRTLRINCSQEQ